MTKSNPDDKYILVNLEESDPRIAFANATITVSFRIADFGFFCLSCLLYQTVITKILELPDRWKNDFKPVYFDLPFPFRPRPKVQGFHNARPECQRPRIFPASVFLSPSV